LGGDFYVADKRFVISHIKSPTAFTIKRDEDGVEFELFDDGRSREIAPKVMASVNLGGRLNEARLNLTAPKSILLATGKNYRLNPSGST
jgi:hypothetical protein